MPPSPVGPKDLKENFTVQLKKVQAEIVKLREDLAQHLHLPPPHTIINIFSKQNNSAKKWQY